MGLPEARRTWYELIESGNATEAERFYKSTVFPAVIESFLAQYPEGKLPEVYGLIVMVGSSPEPLVLSILALKPEKVFFIYTPEFEKNIDWILQVTALKSGSTSAWDKLADPIDSSDITAIYGTIRDRCTSWQKSRGSKQIVVDISGGKKSMVGGAAMAAALLNVQVSYVDNDKYNSQTRKPEPGSEYLRLLPNPFVTLGEAKRARAINHFNDHDYGRAEDLFRTIINVELYGAEAAHLIPQFELYRDLSAAYDCWDNFSFDQAKNRMTKVMEKAERRLVPGLDLPLLKRQLEILGILAANYQGEDKLRGLRSKSLKDYREAIDTTYYKLIRSTEFAEHLALTLFTSAERLAQRSKYGDSVMRLYRTLELVGQYRLARSDINPSKPSLPPEVVSAANTVHRGIAGRDLFPLDRPPRDLGLYQVFVLLYALNDDVWREGSTRLDSGQIKTFESRNSLRNSLLSAHQNQRATETDYTNYRDFVLDFLRRAMPDAEKRLEEHRFARLDG